MDHAIGSPSAPDDVAALVASLSATWFTGGLDPVAGVRLAHLARRYQVPAGTQLQGEGEPVSELGVVLSGRVALHTLVPGRGMVTLLTVEPGEIFGEAALLAPYRATATATALGSLDMLGLDGARLRAALQADCDLAATLYPRLLTTLAARVSATRLRLLELFAGGSDER